MRSLLASLVIGLLLSLAAIFSVQWTFVRAAVNDVVEDYIADGLGLDADELFGSLTVMPGGGTRLALLHFDPPFLKPHSGRYFQILVDGSTALRSQSLADTVLEAVPVNAGQRRVAHVTGPMGHALLMTSRGYDFQGRAVTVSVAEDLRLIHSEFDRLMVRYTEVSVIMFILLVALQIVIVRVVLSPLRRAQADVARLERGEIGQLGEQVPVEMLPLVREVNRLLALLGRRLQRSRESLGNLAHALKAPLAVLTHMAGDEHIRRHAVLGPQMAEQLTILRSRVDSELRRARVAGGRGTSAPLDLSSEIESLIATLRKLYGDRKLDFVINLAAETRFAGDREDFLELCGNLLDNACKWARSRVKVSARHEHGLVLVVEDDGPGCSPEELKRIAQRGVRLDENVEGHGLGLAIARSIAASYDADIRFGRSQELGGFEVTVAFPAA